MKTGKFLTALSCFSVMYGWLSVSTAPAAETTVLMPNGIYATKRVVSLREARYKNVVAQKYDLSCGAASLATILKSYFRVQTDESDIITYLLQIGDREKIAKRGFSLLDLKNYAEHIHFLAAGYKEVSLESLRKLKLPGIVLLSSGRFSHFVVLKGVRGDKVYLADPAFGNRRMDVQSFQNEWDGILFLVASGQGGRIAEVPLESLSAPEMDVVRIQQLTQTGGFPSFRTPGEF